MTKLRGFGRAWDRITIYLPVILMGVLALGTYWLARQTPTNAPPSAERPPSHEPDYFMRGFSVKSFEPTGRLKTEINGTVARHYPDTDTTEIDQPRMRNYDDKGAVTVATADRALSNADGSEVQLFGNAVVTREAKDAQGNPLPHMEIRSEFLDVFANTEKLKTNKPVTLKRGDDQFEGDGMDYDNLSRVLDLRGRVHGILRPRVPGQKPQPAPPAPPAPQQQAQQQSQPQPQQ